MAAAPDDPDNDLSFSDIESDDDDGRTAPRPTSSVIAHKQMSTTIAHKEMKPGVLDAEDEDDDDDNDSVGSPIQEFEPISPVNNNDTPENSEAFEQIIPNDSSAINYDSRTSTSVGHFENISDDDDEDQNEDAGNEKTLDSDEDDNDDGKIKNQDKEVVNQINLDSDDDDDDNESEDENTDTNNLKILDNNDDSKDKDQDKNVSNLNKDNDDIENKYEVKNTENQMTLYNISDDESEDNGKSNANQITLDDISDNENENEEKNTKNQMILDNISDDESEDQDKDNSRQIELNNDNDKENENKDKNSNNQMALDEISDDENDEQDKNSNQITLNNDNDKGNENDTKSQMVLDEISDDESEVKDKGISNQIAMDNNDGDDESEDELFKFDNNRSDNKEINQSSKDDISSSSNKGENKEAEFSKENAEEVVQSNNSESNNVNRMEELEDDDMDIGDVEAPIPSPFSDIGDVDDIAESSGIMNDILKEHDEILRENENNKNTFDIDELKLAEVDEPIDKIESIDETDKSSKDDENKDEPSASSGKLVLKSDDEDEDNVDITVTSDKKVSEEMKSEDQTNEKSDEKVEGEDEESQEDAGDLIANIFGDSDDEEGEFEGFAEEDLPPVIDEEVEEEMKSHSKKDHQDKKERDRDASDDDEPIPDTSFVSDFDIMLEKKRAAAKLKRKSKKDYDACGDNDEIIAAMIRQMKDAAEEDRMLNQCGKAATKKLKMLPTVISHLRKADLQAALIDCGVLPAMKEWLTPLPDRALPHVNIRRLFLKMLIEFPPLDRGALKTSGIGRAVMLLFKHPKEVTENRKMAAKIISTWARPIFNVTTNYNEMSREDRESRDKTIMPESKRRKLESDEVEVSRKQFDEDDDDKLPRKPGDKGWCARARVPQPSHRDYVNRPSSKVENYEFQAANLKTKVVSRFDKSLRKMQKSDATKGKIMKAVQISLNGSKMSL